MCINNIILCLYIIFYIQFGNTYEEGRVLSKDEVLKIKNEYFLSFFCKNDTCVSTSYDYGDYIIEIPDGNGNMIKYITETCTYDELKTYNSGCINKCTSDSQCLSNKCSRNCCVFNDETPVVHCDDIYTPPLYFKERSSYMYCGKAYKDTCKTDDECSSKKCYGGNCYMQDKGPSDSEYIGDAISRYIIVFIIIIIISICWCCWYCFYKNSKCKK